MQSIYIVENSSFLQKGLILRYYLVASVSTYHPAVQDIKMALMANWCLIENRPLLKIIFERPPIISYKRGKSLKDMLERAKM